MISMSQIHSQLKNTIGYLLVTSLCTLYFPYTQVFDIYVWHSIPSKCRNWTSPGYYLVWRSTTMCTLTSHSTSINKVKYLDPVIIIILVNPSLLLYYCFAIFLDVNNYSLKSNPFSHY